MKSYGGSGKPDNKSAALCTLRLMENLNISVGCSQAICVSSFFSHEARLITRDEASCSTSNRRFLLTKRFAMSGLINLQALFDETSDLRLGRK